MKKNHKKKMALASGYGCRACEKSLMDIQHSIGSLDRWADIVFWPYALGSTWRDLDELNHIDVSFFVGAIRTEADRQAARALREKSDLFVSCGACAALGGMPGLANFNPDDSSTKDPDGPHSDWPALPRTGSNVEAVARVVSVDYLIPGCPPPENLLWAALQSLVCDGEAPARLAYAASRLPENTARAIISGVRPPRGTVFAGDKAVCASCSRRKDEKRFKAYQRPFGPVADPERCLLEQGLICLGITTREGCGGTCTAAGLACRGCFGKARAVYDPGAKMVSAISSTFDTDDAGEIEDMVNQFVDLPGTFYRYNLASECPLLNTPVEEQDEQRPDHRAVGRVGRTGQAGC